LEIAPQSPKILGSIEERLRNIEGFLPLNFTSCLAGFKDEVELRGKKPSIFLNISSMLPQSVGDCPPISKDFGKY
jgi:hypothetical protein